MCGLSRALLAPQPTAPPFLASFCRHDRVLRPPHHAWSGPSHRSSRGGLKGRQNGTAEKPSAVSALRALVASHQVTPAAQMRSEILQWL
jgi:hypothetical protein